MRIKSIMVVGGGSSGSMTAAALSKKFGDEVKISILEGKSSNPVGVGESTIIAFNNYLKLLELKDNEWMKHCNATYKTSIRFTNFRDGNGEVFEYPFGGNHTEQSYGQWTALAAKYNLDENSFCEFLNHNYFLAKHNKLTKNKDGKLNFSFDKEIAYHFDASLFGKFVRTKFCKDVTKYVDDIVSVNKDDYGNILELVGDSGSTYTADLFIDCTGFNSILLEKEMGSEFHSFKPWLSNDRALAAHIPYDNKETQISNVTNCTALSSGWSWNIPLWKRMGTGYVYSSDFIDDDSAEKEFREYLGTEDVELRKIKIRHGVRKKGWVKNVVGVGLSYGFIEPLESTGLVSTHEMIIKLVETLERTHLNPCGLDKDGYNYNCRLVLCGYKDFVSVHYKMSKRTDTPYWRYQTEEKDWFGMKDITGVVHVHGEDGQSTGTNAYYEQLLMNHAFMHRWTPDTSGLYYIMAGMGHRPMGKLFFDEAYPPEASSDLENLHKEWRNHVKMIEKHVKSLPSTYEFLKKNIYY
tara:strand:- start:61 stop:1626 length:1566 start_codon:yes stop_codon:yes gene_type:complete